MYRLPIYILIALIISLTASCRREPQPNPSLLRAEKIMDEHPDSALAIVSSLDPDSLDCAADSALYFLLLTQSEIKAGTIIKDSLPIKFAIDHYRRYPAPRRLMLSLYYLGEIQNETASYDKAATNLLEAESLAAELEDWFYLGLIQRNISIAYCNVYNLHVSMIYSIKAVESFKKSGIEDYWNYERCNLASSYISTGNLMEGKQLLDSVRALAVLTNDSLTLATAISQIAYLDLNLGDWRKAILDFKQSEELGLAFNESKDHQSIVLAYQMLGMHEKADSVYNLLDSANGEVYVSLAPYHASKGDYKKAYQAISKLCTSQRKLAKELQEQKVTAASFAYENDLLDKANLKIRNQRLILILSIVIFLFVASLIIICFFYQRKRFRHRFNTLLKDRDILSSELNRLSAEAEAVSSEKADWKKLFKKQFRIIDQFCAEYYNAPSARKTAKLAKLIDTTILGLKNNADFVKGIFEDINHYNNDIITELQASTDCLSDTEYLLLALCCSGLSNQAISIILSIDIDPLYVRKSRLKAKISRLDFQRKAELLNLMSHTKL